MIEPLAEPGHPAGAPEVVSSRPWWDLARIVVIALGAVVLARMVFRLTDVVGLVLLAGSLALVTDPFRRRLARAVPSGVAAALTAVATLVAAVALGTLLLNDLAGQSERLADDLVERIESWQPGSVPAEVAGSLDAADGVRDVLERLPTLVVAGEDDAAGVGRQAIDLLLVVILAAFFQGGASRMVDWLASRWPRHQREEVRAMLADVERRGGSYVRRTVLLAVAVTAAVSGAAWSLDIPGAFVLGCWAGAWAVVPTIGWLVGTTPAVIAGFAAGPTEGLLLLAAALVIALGTGLARRRLVARVGLRLGPALSVIAFAVGVTVAGFGGLFVCLVAASVAAAALTTAAPLAMPGATPAPPGEPVDPALVPDPDRAGSRALLRVDTGAVLVAPGRRGLLTLAGAVVAGVLAWMLAGHLGAAMVWVVVGGLVAVALSRPLGWLGRRAHLPRPAGAAALFVLIATVAGAATVAGVAGGVDTTTELGEELPTVVTELESLPLIGEWLRDREAAAWVEDQMNDLPQRLQEARDMSSWLPTIGARVLDLFWTVLIAFALLLDGPRLLAAVQRRVPAAKRRQFTRLVDVSQRSIGGYLAGAALVAALNAGVVFTIAIALGIALAPVLAVWAFVWNFVPQIGGFMGGFPLVVLALAAGPLAAVVAGTLFVAYQFVENHLIQPTVIGEAIDVPAWVTLLAALAGGAAAGVVGAVVLTPLVGVVRVILATSRRRDFPGSTVPLGDAA